MVTIVMAPPCCTYRMFNPNCWASLRCSPAHFRKSFDKWHLGRPDAVSNLFLLSAFEKNGCIHIYNHIYYIYIVYKCTVYIHDISYFHGISKLFQWYVHGLLHNLQTDVKKHGKKTLRQKRCEVGRVIGPRLECLARRHLHQGQCLHQLQPFGSTEGIPWEFWDHLFRKITPGNSHIPPNGKRKIIFKYTLSGGYVNFREINSYSHSYTNYRNSKW